MGRVGEYKDFKMYYDSGDPSQFWLYADTKSLNDLQRNIQKSLKKKTVGDGGGVGVQEGSLVLARYHVDKLLYRARVEKVTEGLFSVRYIDYANKGENLPESDIYSWDTHTLLNMIPPQAVSCTLHTLNKASAIAYTEEQVNEFTTCMKANSPMQMTVHQRLTSFDMHCTSIGPVTSRPAKHSRPVSVFPPVDVRCVEVTASNYTPPNLPMQEDELDANGKFQFMVSAIVSQEEILGSGGT